MGISFLIFIKFEDLYSCLQGMFDIILKSMYHGIVLMKIYVFHELFFMKFKCNYVYMFSFVMKSLIESMNDINSLSFHDKFNFKCCGLFKSMNFLQKTRGWILY